MDQNNTRTEEEDKKPVSIKIVIHKNKSKQNLKKLEESLGIVE